MVIGAVADGEGLERVVLLVELGLQLFVKVVGGCEERVEEEEQL